MATSLNLAQIVGNLTRDVELRQTSGGQNVATIGVATNRSWNDASGNRQEQAEFHDIVVWGKLAELCAQILKKGQRVYFSGRLQTREWEGQDGQKRRKTEIVADTMIPFAGDRPAGSGGNAPAPSQPAPASTGGEPAESSGEEPVEKVNVNDLPF